MVTGGDGDPLAAPRVEPPPTLRAGKADSPSAAACRRAHESIRHGASPSDRIDAVDRLDGDDPFASALAPAYRRAEPATSGPAAATECEMSEYNQEKLTRDVLEAFAGTPDPRLREIMTGLVRHLHAFVREVDLTPEEWMAGIGFLTETGQISTEKRPEFILLSDTLGLSMMIVSLAQARASGGAPGATEATEATVEGPFYWPGAPDLALGTDIGEGVPGEPTLYTGRVTDCEGTPVAGALLDVWSGDGNGKYDVQLSAEPTMKARGRFRTDAEGRYWFWSIRPNYDPVPDDGTVGRMMRATGRSIHRPGHIHMQVSAPRHVPVTTHIFVAGSPYIDQDAVFGKRDSLVVDFQAHAPGTAPDGRVMKEPYHSANFDFRLARQPA
jgi:hydroxyquinol 1,2-dioxygenase